MLLERKTTTTNIAMVSKVDRPNDWYDTSHFVAWLSAILGEGKDLFDQFQLNVTEGSDDIGQFFSA